MRSEQAVYLLRPRRPGLHHRLCNTRAVRVASKGDSSCAATDIAAQNQSLQGRPPLLSFVVIAVQFLLDGSESAATHLRKSGCRPERVLTAFCHPDMTASARKSASEN